MDRICARAGEARQSQVTKPCQRAGVMDKIGDTTVIENPTRVTKPCQRAGVMDTTARSRPTPTARCHKALSAGRCDGPAWFPRSKKDRRWRHKALSAGRCDGHAEPARSGSPRSSHKALSAGRCDGRLGGWEVFVQDQVTKPCQRAGAMDRGWRCSGGRGKSSHKALSAGRCDGPSNEVASRLLDLLSQSPVSGQVRWT